MKRHLFAAALVVLTACSSGSDQQVLNGTLPTPSSVTLPRGPIATEAGGIITKRLSLDWTEHQVPDAFEQVVDPDTLKLDPSVLERLRAVGTKVRYLPVIVRLPVAYDALARGKALVAAKQATVTDTKAGNIPVMSTDPAIVAATKQLSDALAQYPDWGTRAVTSREMAHAWDTYRALAAQQPVEGLAPGDVQSRAVTGASYVAQLGQTPYVRVLLTASEVEALAGAKLIVGAGIDAYATIELESATDTIGSGEATKFLGYKGTGTAVAIVDTGVLATHPAFGSRVVVQRCYSSDESCDNGRTSDTGSSSALPCTFHDKCDHGTHVAGIAAGQEVTSGTTTYHAGVAPGASILAYRTASRYEDEGDRPTFYTSDFLLAAGHVASVAARYNVSSLNYSVGSEETFPGVCDDVDDRAASSAAMLDAIDTLRAVNVAVVIAAGNEDQRDETSWPGCLSSPVTVSATDDTDAVAGFSNVSEVTDLYAPGVDIVAASSSGTSRRSNAWETKQGTSMSAPMVTGAWALVRQLSPTMNVASVLDMLQDRGVSVTDRRTDGVETAPRLDLRGILPGGTTTGATVSRVFAGDRMTVSGGGSFSYDSGYDAWAADVTLTDAGFTPPTATYAAVYFTVRGGKPTRVGIAARKVGETTYPRQRFVGRDFIVQTGYSRGPCRDTDHIRSYRVEMTGVVDEENIVRIWLDDKEAVIDGVSIFAVSAPVTTSTRAAVVVTEGLGVLNDESASMSASLPHSTRLDGRDASLHLAVADGQEASESGIAFKTSTSLSGVTVSAADGFSRSAGPNWDDVTVDLTGAGLTGTPGLAFVTHDGVAPTKDRDCLAIAAAMLNIGRKPYVMPDVKAAPLGAARWTATPAVVTPTILFAAPAAVRR